MTEPSDTASPGFLASLAAAGRLFDDLLHPRGPGGKFAKKAGEAVKNKAEDLVDEVDDGGIDLPEGPPWTKEMFQSYVTDREKAKALFNMEGGPGKLSMRSMSTEMAHGGNTVAVHGIVVNDKGERIGDFSRAIRSNGSIEHDMLAVDEPGQRSGLARAMLQDAIPRYRAAGFNQVETLATLEVGGYAWARLGFDLTKGSEIYRVKSLGAPEFNALLKKAKKGEVTMQELALWRGVDKNGKPVTGRDHLLGSGWEGHINLRDPAHVRRVMKAFGAVVDEHLTAAGGLFDDMLHPRGPGGKFAKKMGRAAKVLDESGGGSGIVDALPPMGPKWSKARFDDLAADPAKVKAIFDHDGGPDGLSMKTISGVADDHLGSLQAAMVVGEVFTGDPEHDAPLIEEMIRLALAEGDTETEDDILFAATQGHLAGRLR